MDIKTSFTVLLAAATCLLTSCYNSAMEEPERVAEVTRAATAGGSDPYRLEAMQAAFDRVAENNPELAGIKLAATHRYVRIHPADTTQMGTLLDLEIDLYDYPLDTPRQEGNAGYEDEITPGKDEDKVLLDWYYAVIPVDMELPEDIEHETIYEVLIQREDDVTRSVPQLSAELYKKVLTQSKVLTGNIPASTRSGAETTWRPRARIGMVSESEEDYYVKDSISLAGIKVQVRDHTNVVFKYTDENGETEPFGEYQGAVDYEIRWQHNHWDIMNGRTSNVYVTALRSGMTEELEHVITSDEGCALAAVHNALYTYYHRDFPETRCLPKRSHTELAFIKKDGISNFNPLNRNEIHIFILYNSGRYIEYRRLLETTLHELGHASHYEMQPGFGFKGNKLYESWANGVGYAYMSAIYDPLTACRYVEDGDEVYTHIVESLMRNGYSFAQIQEAVKHAEVGRAWASFRDNIKALKILPDAQVDVLFDNQSDVCISFNDFIKTYSEFAYLDQFVFFFLDIADVREEKRDYYAITDCEVVDDDGVEISKLSKQVVALRFTTPGEKKIRFTLRIKNKVSVIVEKDFHVDGLNFLDIPDQIYTVIRNEVSLRGETNIVEGTQLRFCGATDGSSDIIIPTAAKSSLQAGMFFRNSGTKEVKFEIWYPSIVLQSGKRRLTLLGGFTDNFTRTIEVIDLPPNMCFELLTQVSQFEYGETYKLRYLPPEPSIIINKVLLISNRFYFNIPVPEWSYNNRVLQFTIPAGHEFPLDFRLYIEYSKVGSGEIFVAEIPVTNMPDDSEM